MKKPTHVVKKIPPNMVSASFVLEKHKLLQKGYQNLKRYYTRLMSNRTIKDPRDPSFLVI
jgi:hypothetical protein